jgi:hypothetical protein
VYEIQAEKSINVTKEHIVAIIESINKPMVAAAGKPLESTKAYILGMRQASGLYSIYVYLHLLQSKECLIYLHDPGEIAMEAYHETEIEALQFVESMGFMVDNCNFRNLSPQQQQALLDQMPMFSEDLEEFDRRTNAGDGAAEEGDEDEENLDLGPLEENVIDLDEVAEIFPEPAEVKQVISKEGLAKIIRLFSSF